MAIQASVSAPYISRGPPAVFSHKKNVYAPSGTLCARITPMQAAHSAHSAHTRDIRQKQQTLISRNILNTATLKSAATAARQCMHTRRRVTRRPWALPPPPPPSPPPLPPPPGSTRESRDRSTGHRVRVSPNPISNTSVRCDFRSDFEMAKLSVANFRGI